MTNFNDSELKEHLIHAANLLFQCGVMSHSGHGNLSVRLPGTEATVTFDGDVVEGTIDPVMREIVAMHSGVYRQRPGVGAVIHTHSPHVTSFALAHQPLPCVYEALLRFGVTEDIPVADWAPRGSLESVANIVLRLQEYPIVPAVLLANHGLLAFGRDALYTAQLIIVMEEAAELTLRARALGGEKSLPADALARERKHMQQFGSLR